MRTRNAFLSILFAALLASAACKNMPEPTAPSASEDVLSQRGNDMVDVIVVLDHRPARGNRAANRERAAEFAQGLGLAVTHTYGAVLHGFSAAVPRGRLEALRRNPRVVHVELDRQMSVNETVTETGLDERVGMYDASVAASTQIVPWGVNRIGAREAGGTGSGVHVYVVDSGIDPSHSDLQANLGEGHTVFKCQGNPKNCPGWADDNGHGTHVAGTIGAADDQIGVVGVAPDVTLHAVKVLGADGWGYASDIVAGLDWVADHNSDQPRVANVSIGGGGGKTGTCTQNGVEDGTNAFETAFCNSANAGVVIVAPAGNEGGDATGFAPAAYYEAVMAVSYTSCGFIEGASSETCTPGSEAFAITTNWGQGTDSEWESEGSLPVVLAAPGLRVLSTEPGGYRYMSGTSMAAPHVAGAAALVLQQLGGSLPPDGSALRAVRAALLAASECTETWHNLSGNPHSERFLNVRNAAPIDVCVEPGDPPPSPPTNMRVTGATSSSIDLAWDHDSPLDASFELWHYDGGWGHLTYVEGMGSHTVTGLSAGTSYSFAVRTVTEFDRSIFSFASGEALPDETSDPPVAAFSYDCGNSDTCSFASQSTGPIESWSWDLGNGLTATSPYNQSATYAAAGTYTVTLTVEDALARVDVAQAQISCSVKGRWLRCN